MFKSSTSGGLKPLSRSPRTLSSKDLIARFPSLIDLAEEGDLIAWERPTDYVERREDGYQEPELVVVVGTTHIGESSARIVDRVISTAQPDCVVVELCASRRGFLEEQTDHPSQTLNSFSLQGTSRLAALSQLVRDGTGIGPLLLRVLMSRLSESSAEAAGASSLGSEFRAARRSSEAIEAAGGKCELVLGDRPIGLTLSFAWEALSFMEKLSLVKDLVLANALPSDEKAVLTRRFMEDLQFPDAQSGLDRFYDWMATRYPPLLPILVKERDQYLTWSLRRSKAVNGKRVVVGVVGRGHLPGIQSWLNVDSSELRFNDLVRNQNQKGTRVRAQLKSVGKLALETLAFFLVLNQLHLT